MGYTHYWRQQRDFTETEWQELTRLTKLILADVLKLQLYSDLNITKE